MAGTVWPTLTQGNRAKASELESKFDWLEADIVPMLAGSKVDATYDIGQSTFRFRDYYASRQFLGPAGSTTTPPFGQNGATTNGIYFPTSAQVAATSVFVLQDGSVGTPSLSLLNSPTTGFYRIGANNIGLAAAGAQAWNVSAAGEILAPLQPCFAATAVTQSNVIGTGGFTITSYTELFDQGNDFASGIFTAPITGHYHLIGTIDLSWPNTTTTNTITFAQISIIVAGGRSVSQGHNIAYNPTPVSVVQSADFAVSSIFSLTSGDTVYMTAGATQRASNDVSINGSHTSFAGFLVG